MRRAVPAAIAALASGCQLVYPLDAFDAIPHVPAALETAGDADLVIPDNGTPVALDTSGELIDLGPPFTDVTFDIVKQTDGTTDVVVLRARNVVIEGVLNLEGTRPLIVIAETISIEGTLDAGAIGTRPGPGGAFPRAMRPGEGGQGLKTGQFRGNHAGGGGGAFALGAADGGDVECGADSLMGGGAGVAFGDAALTVLEGGGAGGAGGFDCTVTSDGGAGGGAVQLSAFESITIEGTLLAGGGGGQGGRSGGVCDAREGAGSGGGAGGAIYLDAPLISNSGVITATGGGGGGGASATADGGNGQDARGVVASMGGVGTGKGTSGGNGGTVGNASPGITGTCGGTNLGFNTGGGGGSVGRIVFRGTLDRVGTVLPTATELPR